MTYAVDETTLVFAFRYALNRHTGATTHMVGVLKRHWDNLAEWTQRQIQSEIENAALEREPQTWDVVLTWPVKDEYLCNGCGAAHHVCLCSHEDDAHT